MEGSRLKTRGSAEKKAVGEGLHPDTGIRTRPPVFSTTRVPLDQGSLYSPGREGKTADA